MTMPAIAPDAPISSILECGTLATKTIGKARVSRGVDGTRLASVGSLATAAFSAGQLA